MSIRESINRNPKPTAIVVGLFVAACIGLIVWQTLGGSSGGGGGGGGVQLFFTTDGGKTWFPDAYDKTPPFDRGGNPAVRVHVFQCGENGKPFAGYLERVNPAAHKRVADLKAKGATAELESVMISATEVMKPGGGKWVPAYSPAGTAIATPACPGGEADTGPVMPVLP